VNISLLDAGNSAAAYLHLNGRREVAASLITTTNNRVRTDAADGTAGELMVNRLTVEGVAKPGGTYTATTARWIEGKGQVVVRP
jgi:hypothetical protein